MLVVFVSTWWESSAQVNITEDGNVVVPLGIQILEVQTQIIISQQNF